LAQLKTVHTVLWPHCPNKNVFSNRLNWPYDDPHSLRLGGRLFQTCGPAAEKVSKTAVHLTDECLSVSRTQLSDTVVNDELTVVGQVTKGVARQGPVDTSRNLEHDALLHRKSVQLVQQELTAGSQYKEQIVNND